MGCGRPCSPHSIYMHEAVESVAPVPKHACTQKGECLHKDCTGQLFLTFKGSAHDPHALVAQLQ